MIYSIPSWLNEFDGENIAIIANKILTAIKPNYNDYDVENMVNALTAYATLYHRVRKVVSALIIKNDLEKSK